MTTIPEEAFTKAISVLNEWPRDQRGREAWHLVTAMLEAAAPAIIRAEQERIGDQIHALLTSGPIGRVSGERYIRADLIRAVLNGPEELDGDPS